MFIDCLSLTVRKNKKFCRVDFIHHEWKLEKCQWSAERGLEIDI